MKWVLASDSFPKTNPEHETYSPHRKWSDKILVETFVDWPSERWTNFTGRSTQIFLGYFYESKDSKVPERYFWFNEDKKTHLENHDIRVHRWAYIEEEKR